MRVTQLFSILAALAVMIAVPAAQEAVTIEGTLVDSKCYLAMGQAGDDHGNVAKCGEMCLKMGQPAGLVTADDTFHTIIAPAGDLAAHVGHTVRITGQLRGGAILATKAEMSANGSYTEIPLSGMM